MYSEHVAILGAGAVGCYFGGMLARAGVRVTLIGREQHVGEIHHRIVTGVAPAKTVEANLSVGELHRVLLRKCLRWAAWNLSSARVLLHPALQSVQSHHLGAGIDELLVISDVIGMVMGVDYKLHGLIRHRLDFFHQTVEILTLGRRWRVRWILSVYDD